MKNIEPKLIEALLAGGCAPQIMKLARATKTASATIHYNIKRMEKEGKIRAYKAVFDYSKINRGFCTYVLVNLSDEGYRDPEKIAKELARFDEVESVDLITGDWEMLLKVRTKDIDDYYRFVQAVYAKRGLGKTKSLSSLKQIKTEFVEMP